MDKHVLMTQQIGNYGRYLHTQERSPGTVEKYLRDTGAFFRWLEGRVVTREVAAQWKTHLLAQGYAPVSVNSMLSALNGLFRFLGWEDCRVNFLRIQRQLFRDSRRELTRPEYERLLSAAQSLGRKRLALLMQAMCATGVRVSEVRYLTVEAAWQGRAEISLKGKIWVILLPGKLCRKLLRYAGEQHITTGAIFRTERGRELGRRQIWAELKGLCQYAGVEPGKVFPHNLRHLFATIFYRAYKVIAQLADVLGHSSLETTRIYLITTGAEYARQLDRLGLVQ